MVRITYTRLLHLHIKTQFIIKFRINLSDLVPKAEITKPPLTPKYMILILRQLLNIKHDKYNGGHVLHQFHFNFGVPGFIIRDFWEVSLFSPFGLFKLHKLMLNLEQESAKEHCSQLKEFVARMKGNYTLFNLEFLHIHGQ